MQFDNNQRAAVNRLKSGSILVGGTGSGKSRTALVYFFSKECGGKIIDSFVYFTLHQNVFLLCLLYEQ